MYQLQNTFPVRLDITIRQGSIFQVIPLWTVRNAAGEMEPFDVSGYIAKMQVRTRPDTEPIATYSTDNARILLPVSGQDQVVEWESSGIFIFADSTKQWNIWIRIPATDTAGLPAGVYLYDLELEPPGNPSGRFAFYAGTCRVEAEVTK